MWESVHVLVAMMLPDHAGNPCAACAHQDTPPSTLRLPPPHPAQMSAETQDMVMWLAEPGGVEKLSYLVR